MYCRIGTKCTFALVFPYWRGYKTHIKGLQRNISRLAWVTKCRTYDEKDTQYNNERRTKRDRHGILAWKRQGPGSGSEVGWRNDAACGNRRGRGHL